MIPDPQGWLPGSSCGVRFLPKLPLPCAVPSVRLHCLRPCVSTLGPAWKKPGWETPGWKRPEIVLAGPCLAAVLAFLHASCWGLCNSTGYSHTSH